MRHLFTFLISLFCLTLLISCAKQSADLILTNGEIYTMEESQPWAATVVITGNKITAVLEKNESYKSFQGKNTRLIDLQGKFVVPGFIDGHVHFNRAGALINDANLMKVADDEGLRAEIQRVVNILGDGEWITGGLWGAYEQWALGADKADAKMQKRWEPDRWMIDDISDQNPCLLCNFDYQLFLANTAALKAAEIENARLEGMKLDADGNPTGLIYRGSPALEKIRSVIKEKSHSRILNENRAALKHLRECGIVEIHDIATPEQIKRFIELQLSLIHI